MASQTPAEPVPPRFSPAFFIFYNAQCAVPLGAGLVMAEIDRAPDAIRMANSEPLANPTYRTAAEQARDAMAALTALDQAVRLLDRLATEPQPLLAP
jgi:UDP:flavonoid glycosyltransferase YjiC (YdhE family)